MTSQGTELPMAISGCALAPADAAEQASRYARLGASATIVDQHQRRLEITFSSAVDEDLLAATIAIERSCCGFLTIEYDPAIRRLSLRAGDANGTDALTAIRSAIAAPRSSRGG
jgi:hypothetical protein